MGGAIAAESISSPRGHGILHHAASKIPRQRCCNEGMSFSTFPGCANERAVDIIPRPLLRDHRTQGSLRKLSARATLPPWRIVVVNPNLAALESRRPRVRCTILAAAFVYHGHLRQTTVRRRAVHMRTHSSHTPCWGMSAGNRLVPFVAGVLFLILTLCGTLLLASAISPNLKHSFAIGIGLFYSSAC